MLGVLLRRRKPSTFAAVVLKPYAKYSQSTLLRWRKRGSAIGYGYAKGLLRACPFKSATASPNKKSPRLAGAKADDHAYGARGIGLRSLDPRHGRKRDRTCRQVQKSPARKFHFGCSIPTKGHDNARETYNLAQMSASTAGPDRAAAFRSWQLRRNVR